MDDRRFDVLTRSFATERSRRALLKGWLGLGAATTAGVVLSGRADAARRGFGGRGKAPGSGEPTCGDALDTCPSFRDNTPQCGAPDVTLYCCPSISGRLFWVPAIC